MDSLRTGDAVFKKVSIFDYQGLCLDDKNRTSNSDANFILTVSSVVKLCNLNYIILIACIYAYEASWPLREEIESI